MDPFKYKFVFRHEVVTSADQNDQTPAAVYRQGQKQAAVATFN
jgi:hypothetical protein